MHNEKTTIAVVQGWRQPGGGGKLSDGRTRSADKDDGLPEDGESQSSFRWTERPKMLDFIKKIWQIWGFHWDNIKFSRFHEENLKIWGF